MRGYSWILGGFSKKIPKLELAASLIFGAFRGWEKEKKKRK